MESRIGIVFVAWCLAFPGSGDAQQVYNEPDQFGYSCTATTQCQAYAAYRALAEDTLRTVGMLFGLSDDQVATASGVSTGLKQLSAGQLFLIPLNCSCQSGRSQYNTTTYIIQKGDTFYLASTDKLQGLTTYQAVERANPSLQPTKLEPGDKIICPIRCSCPTKSQIAAGVKTLITYPVAAGDSIAAIARAWNVSQADIQSENTGVTDPSLREATTLLLPTIQDPPKLPKNSVPVTPATSPAAPPAPPVSTGDGGSSKTGTYVGIAGGASAAVVLAVLEGICWRRRSRKKQQMPPEAVNASSLEDSDVNSDPILKQQKQGVVDSEKPAMFSYEELQEATNGFSPSHLIQGSVYRGMLRGEIVAIKEIKGGTTSLEFKILCKVHHINLVRLVGVCSWGNQLFLVYEYANNGSLSSWLHPHHKIRSSPSLGSSAYLRWNTRLQIAMDVATGLEYIHGYTKPGFVHKDINCSNILLDSSFRAKIANFGMARLAKAPALTKHIVGTPGYMAPEYLAHGFITTKVDVYAFGVVLLELLTGREAILSNSSNPKESYLAEVVVKLLDEISEGDQEHRIEKLKALVDPVLENTLPWDSALSLALLARL